MIVHGAVFDEMPYPEGPNVCRVLETRTCPYPEGCAEQQPCARFESDDPLPWEQ